MSPTVRSGSIVTLVFSTLTLPGAERDFKPRRVVPPIRPIVDAPTIPGKDVSGQIDGNELVLGVVVGGAARAYSINMLTGPRREIINDVLGGVTIAATW